MNDASGIPIEIVAVVVWRIVDTERATFKVHDVSEFVSIQRETAIRHLGKRYPYDDLAGDQLSLANTEEVVATLHAELDERLTSAGVDIVEAGSATWPTRPRSPRPCCAASRRPPWARRGVRSSRVRSAWSKTPST